jgi:hypothetical protein
MTTTSTINANATTTPMTDADRLDAAAWFLRKIDSYADDLRMVLNDLHGDAPDAVKNGAVTLLDRAEMKLGNLRHRITRSMS